MAEFKDPMFCWLRQDGSIPRDALFGSPIWLPSNETPENRTGLYSHQTVKWVRAPWLDGGWLVARDQEDKKMKEMVYDLATELRVNLFRLLDSEPTLRGLGNGRGKQKIADAVEEAFSSALETVLGEEG